MSSAHVPGAPQRRGRPCKARGPRSEFAVGLREVRRIRGVTQTQLAALLGMYQPVIAMIEGGTRAPTAAQREALENWIRGEVPMI